MATQNKYEIYERMTREEFKKQFLIEYPVFLQKLFLKCPGITPDEMDVCACILKGLPVHVIHEILGIPERTIETHKRTVTKKLGLDHSQRLGSFLKTL